MSKKNLIDKTFLFEAMNEINDGWIEQAVDYKRSSKIISFPFYKYVNAVAALIICIISTVVFVQLKPVNEINETLIIPTVQPTEAVETDIVTDNPTEGLTTEAPSPSESVAPTKITDLNNTDRSENELIDNFHNRYNSNILVVPPVNNESDTTNKDNDTVVRPTVKPGSLGSYVPTDKPIKTSKPDFSESPLVTENPEFTVLPQETNIPTESDIPIITIEPTYVPSLVPSLGPTEIWTAIPTMAPTVKPTPTRIPMVPSVNPTVTPGWTKLPEITPVPTSTPRPTGPVLPEEVPPVYGTAVEIKSLNGALYDEESKMIEFTSESVKSGNGVEIINPIAGNTSKIEDYGYLYDEVAGNLINVFRLTGSKLGWGRDEEKLPIPEGYVSMENIDSRVWPDIDNDKILYPRPKNAAGFSISFWAKTPIKNDNSALLVFANEDQTVSISIGGTAKYVDGLNILNKFYAFERSKVDTNWHYYTITFANDWISVYRDGLDIDYDHVELRLSEIAQFNDGFLTRKNGSYAFENQRYKGENSVERLLLTFMTDENTKVYLGGGEVSVANATSKFSFAEGTKIYNVEYYLRELNYKQVYANYNLARWNPPW